MIKGYYCNTKWNYWYKVEEAFKTGNTKWIIIAIKCLKLIPIYNEK